MAFELNSVVPWGRTLKEYQQMFALSDNDLSKRIISFGDGPASFNAEMHRVGKQVISIDPLYRFSVDDIKKRIDETCLEVIGQMRANASNFIWKGIRNVEELQQIRMAAMSEFLLDFEQDREHKRYIDHALPDRTLFDDNTFELGLSSHFLLLYDNLGLNFHLEAITEIMRVCHELRIFPILNLDAKKPIFFDELLAILSRIFITDIQKVPYEFQKGGDEMLIIKSNKHKPVS
jgi:hypothetical protein